MFAPNARGPRGYGSAVAAHYSEQVLLLGDQGIWYAPIAPPIATSATRRTRRETYGLPPAPRDDGGADAPVVLACLGSVFKLHPDYDRVLHRILVAAPHAHLALLTGRREAWTARVRERLRSVLEEAPPGSAGYVNASARVHFLPRQRGESAFVEMIAAVADVVLHPFPFGGSKTAADALAAGRPFVAIHGAALRGHMAVALLEWVLFAHLFCFASSFLLFCSLFFCLHYAGSSTDTARSSSSRAPRAPRRGRTSTCAPPSRSRGGRAFARRSRRRSRRSATPCGRGGR